MLFEFLLLLMENYASALACEKECFFLPDVDSNKTYYEEANDPLHRCRD